jgi:GT2 family glycosyltransferase
MADGALRPVWLRTLDLDEPFADASAPVPAVGSAYHDARLLVRMHGRPLGQVDVAVTGARLLAATVADAVWRDLAEPITEHLADDGLPPLLQLTPDGIGATRQATSCTWTARLGAAGAPRPLVSVVLATHRRPQRLDRTLRTLQAQTYRDIEVLVVDNAPDGPAAERVVAGLHDARFHYLVEPRPGASRARNLGLHAATADLVAFTDDDVDTDPDWVGHLVAAFGDDPDIGCVTGLILPARLDTAAELLIEQFGGFSKGYRRRTFSLDDTDHGPLYPYNAGLFGSGANAAFRRSLFLDLGGFPVELGPATHARGGEDLDGYLSVLMAGHRIVYEPAAIVRHEHRQGDAQLAQQVYSYGIGLSAMITKRIVDSPAERRAVLRALPAAARYVLASDSAKNAGKSTHYPRRLTAYELVGLAYGPFAYLRSRASARRSASGPAAQL